MVNNIIDYKISKYRLKLKNGKNNKLLYKSKISYYKKMKSIFNNKGGGNDDNINEMLGINNEILEDQVSRLSELSIRINELVSENNRLKESCQKK